MKTVKYCLTRVVKKGWHVTWLDNFSKFYGCDMQGISQGAWKECLWTGKAVMSVRMPSRFGRPPLVSQLHQAGVPPDLFRDEHIADVTRDCVTRFKQDRHDFHSKSISVLTNVNTIPPKPTVQPGMDAALEHRIIKAGDGLDTFHPDDILEENIGSNEGLMHILRCICTMPSRIDLKMNNVCRSSSWTSTFTSELWR